MRILILAWLVPYFLPYLKQSSVRMAHAANSTGEPCAIPRKVVSVVASMGFRFCGDTDEYCLISSGCQSNCTDGTPTATVTVSTPSATETTKASSSGGITGDRLIILIIGCVVGVFVIAAVCFMIRSWWKHKERMEETRAAQHNPFASVGERRAFELGLYMSGQTALPAQPGRAAIMPAIVNQHSPYGNGAIDNSRHVHDIGSDDGND
ncbi:hypothetical protein K432DRAFT_409583 [Lepidopterella palustris CBS 459.81]|uniref:Uncharacterized protein n=1 Tax=Lepidopterella palustris CBS 459.81 TaxID=1314670 RepID=A0A8E2JAG4_9PEZI|nr:hypothetical protein K432DRAFT_409583 [Lepidopterella palustris CBS 459.81]